MRSDSGLYSRIAALFLSRKVFPGKCPAHRHREAVPGQRRCQECRDYLAERYMRCNEKGVCPSHVENQVVPGRKHCQKCLDSLKARKRRALDKGNCVHHRNRGAVPGTSTCASCKARVSENRLKRLYSMTQMDYMAMYKAQQGRCAICLDPRYPLGTDDVSFSLCIDHDHLTGRVRSLLCLECNVLVGHIEDNHSRLQGIADYLSPQRPKSKGD
jgi:hypothetical protein